jgi:LuxR family maltose regulon positive regulatory protein
VPEDGLIRHGAQPDGRAGGTGVRQAGEPPARPLLTSKLAVAPLPGPVVARPRLLRLLDAGSAGPITLVSAPAGWGKTLLLSSWYRAREAGTEQAWLSVEPGDNGGRLWSYVHAALRGTGAGHEPDEVFVATPAEPPDQGFLDHLAAGLARRAEPVTLVLDDFHQVDDPAVLDGFEYLLRHAGERLHVVIGARTDPALALHRRRLNGELTEIRAGELAFTADEAVELLTAHGVTVPAGHAHDLRARTEGWPAGLRLAALSLRGHPDPPRYVDEFAGDHPDVAAYLADEVLAELPGDVRECLRRTATVERFSGDLVNTLTGRTDGDQLLAELERRAGFVIALGTRPPSYRWHRMFGELLRAELHRRPTEEILELHRRAAAWHGAHDLPVGALRHALAAREWSHAIRVLADHWPELVPYGQGHPAVAPLAPPPDAVRADPELALAYAAERLDLPDLDAATSHLHLAAEHEQSLAGERRDRFALLSTVLQLARAQLGGEAAVVRALATRLLALVEPAGPGAGAVADLGDQPPSGQVADLPSVPSVAGRRAAGPAARAIARTALGVAQLGAGELRAAEAELTDGMADAERVGLSRAALVCASRLALVHAVRGRLRAADQSARAALAMPPGPGRFGPADVAHAYLALAIVAVQRDRLADAETQLALAAQSPDDPHEPAVAALRAMIRAQLLGGRGDLAASYQVLLAGRQQLTDQPGARELTHLLLAAEADLRTARGDVDTARALLLPPLEEGVEQAESLAVALARAYLQAGEPRAAARNLPDWDSPAAERWLLSVRLEAGLLDALTARQLGDDRRAARMLERVLQLAEPEGFRRVFTRAEPPARDLLAGHLDSGTAYWPTLSELVAVSAEAGGRETPVSSTLGEPLTDRELTILRYLQSILSNVEIATELSLSVNTVKTHVRNIYRKLDATRRREAVRRARELHLL